MKFKRYFSALMVGLAIAFASTADTTAQGRNAYSRGQIDDLVRQLEESSDEFTNDFRQEINNSGLNGSTRRAYNNYAQQFENAVDRLRRRFDSDNSWWQSRNEVRNLISNSQNLNNAMNSATFRRRLERQWNRLRNSVNRLAEAYELPGLGGDSWNGDDGGGGNGGRNPGRGNVPSWAQGTFYGRNPETGGTITLTVNRDGSVMISFDGNQPIYASIDRTTLQNGQYTSRVSRINNGIRTTDVSNGSYIDYFRTPPYGGGGWNGGNDGGGRGDVPNWAVGTFYGRNPETGGTITLSIQRNGNVMIIFDGQNTVNASMNGTTLTNGQYVSRVTRINNGIRTTDVNNGSYIDYYRR